MTQDEFEAARRRRLMRYSKEALATHLAAMPPFMENLRMLASFDLARAVKITREELIRESSKLEALDKACKPIVQRMAQGNILTKRELKVLKDTTVSGKRVDALVKKLRRIIKRGDNSLLSDARHF